MSPETILYTGVATATGGRDGRAVSSDNVLSVQLDPEGAGRCGRAGHEPRADVRGRLLRLFHRRAEVRRGKAAAALPADSSITGNVGIGQIPGGFGLKVRLDIKVPGLPKEQVQQLVEAAHHVCPYSNATRGNIDVTLNVI